MAKRKRQKPIKIFELNEKIQSRFEFIKDQLENIRRQFDEQARMLSIREGELVGTILDLEDFEWKENYEYRLSPDFSELVINTKTNDLEIEEGGDEEE